MNKKGIAAIFGFFILFIMYSAAYTVDETEQVVITRLGKVVGTPITNAGLKFKIPVIDQANFFPKNLQVWDGERGEIPTQNKTYIWVDTFARWRIKDAVNFYKTCGGVEGGIGKIDDIIDPAVKNTVASYHLIESVRNTDRKFDSVLDTEDNASETDYVGRKIKYGREKLTKQILHNAAKKLAGFGIELMDVKIKRINYREDVRDAVYDRMIAERMQIVEKYRAQGKGEAEKISGDMQKELKRITSEAYEKAEIIKGKADAEVTKLYASAYGRDPEFYSFLRSLEIYGKVVDKDTTLIISTDSDFLRYIKKIK